MTPNLDLSRSIAGKTVLITGAASGMGRATAHLFAAQGARVMLSDIYGDGARAVAAQIRDDGFETVDSCTLDVGQAEAIEKAVALTVKKFGGLDILINNAGFARLVHPDDEVYEQIWEASLNVMLTGQQRLIRAALPYLRQTETGGRIVNIASTEGLGATPLNGPYVAAKHGVIGLTRAMAIDLGREGITCNCICPGPIETSINAAIPDADKVIFAKRRVPLRRYGRPEEVAHITLSCCLPAATYLNGAVIPVDGGLSIKNA